ncbi:nitrile hydratase accessory protein [Trinickia violacea]|uniref:Nitrile hydratase accessory protein n=1 Tax=Trinickia violacea TaxID=2571746 RepID=A0A4P8J3A3_9BURK|nr:nitrile hydratase accessory protein [Trinickia violacea]QCP52979.1 nitrile hydratase accessory protein [Trinickia violacea]
MSNQSDELPGTLRDDDSPRFQAPWQAQAFAMAVALHERGLFTWSEWTRALAGQIAKAQVTGDAGLDDNYYHCWLSALETLIAAKGASSEKELLDYQRAWGRAAARTSHGQPIELQREDFES